MKVSIIGAGLQCRRRASVLVQSTSEILVSIASQAPEQARAVANQFSCEVDFSWKETVARHDIDAIVVCTPPSSHAEIAIAAMRAGKHVLCEKPLSKSFDEAQEMVKVAHDTRRILKCGFNLRHHPAVIEGKKRCEDGWIGKPLFARCRYGHCGRPDYENEWRADPSFAAGGQFIEQGSHAIDLIRWFMGEISEVACMTSNHYFKKQPLEDDGFAIFRMNSGATASLHTSLVQWKNLFSFEVFGNDGYICIEGLGGGYGVEKLYLGKRDFNLPFQDLVIQYRGADTSWRDEWVEFTNAIKDNRNPLGSGVDGLRAMRAGLAAYEAQRLRRVIDIGEC